jgi:hypothetical protein
MTRLSSLELQRAFNVRSRWLRRSLRRFIAGYARAWGELSEGTINHLTNIWYLRHKHLIEAENQAPNLRV